jgi:uncharacterized protein
VRFGSAGETLFGVLHLPAGPGPHPVVVLLHGIPGYERNFDLAQALRRAGYATLVFHYRGSWGVGGTWSWRHLLEDAAAAIAALRSPEMAAEHRLDPQRVALVGHSVGGFVALMTAAADPGIRAVASVAGADLGVIAAATAADPAVRAQWVEIFDEDLLPLRGTSGEALVAEMEAAGPTWRLAGLAPALQGRPVLLVGAGRDVAAVVSLHHEPLVRAYADNGLLEHVIFPTDHPLSDHRVELAGTVRSFLERRL